MTAYALFLTSFLKIIRHITTTSVTEYMNSWIRWETPYETIMNAIIQIEACIPCATSKTSVTCKTSRASSRIAKDIRTSRKTSLHSSIVKKYGVRMTDFMMIETTIQSTSSSETSHVAWSTNYIDSQYRRHQRSLCRIVFTQSFKYEQTDTNADYDSLELRIFVMIPNDWQHNIGKRFRWTQDPMKMEIISRILNVKDIDLDRDEFVITSKINDNIIRTYWNLSCVIILYDITYIFELHVSDVFWSQEVSVSSSLELRLSE